MGIIAFVATFWAKEAEASTISVLTDAIEFSNTDKIRDLVRTKRISAEMRIEHETCLTHAIRTSRPAVVRCLLELGASTLEHLACASSFTGPNWMELRHPNLTLAIERCPSCVLDLVRAEQASFVKQSWVPGTFLRDELTGYDECVALCLAAGQIENAAGLVCESFRGLPNDAQALFDYLNKHVVVHIVSHLIVPLATIVTEYVFLRV